MANLKAITGHTSARGVMHYLERGGRALARDFLNLAPPVAGEGPGDLPGHGPYDWAAAMDATRAAAGNDLPCRGRAARTWKHYAISPDPRNGVSLDELRELATAWARRRFPDCEVAIVYHDDNAGRIPHAHVVVNNTVLSAGRRLQVPDPLELNRSPQRMEAERGFAHRYSNERAGSGRGRPRTAQRVHVRRAEREIAARGGRSWVADIRGRVEAARGERREGREGEPMVVEVSYADGREDVFDLERLCEGRGQPLATEYRLRFDRMESDGLWVEANSYGPGEGGVAERRRGWRLMLASPEEVRSIESMSRDGRLRYWRLGGSLVDDRRLSAAEQRLYEGDPGACLLRRALWLDGAVSRARPDLGAEEACALCGFTLAAREEAAEAVSAAGEGA